jgi:hypothetical protein
MDRRDITVVHSDSDSDAGPRRRSHSLSHCAVLTVRKFLESHSCGRDHAVANGITVVWSLRGSVGVWGEPGRPDNLRPDSGLGGAAAGRLDEGRGWKGRSRFPGITDLSRSLSHRVDRAAAALPAKLSRVLRRLSDIPDLLFATTPSPTSPKESYSEFSELPGDKR